MFDRRNDCSLMALEDHCCLLIVTLALVGGGGACRRCIIGASPFKARNVSSMIVYVTRCYTGSQWSFFNIGVKWSRLSQRTANRAA